MNSETCPQWTETEITLRAAHRHADPYAAVEVRAKFVHTTGRCILRPGFPDGDGIWRVRFTSPESDGAWTWSTESCPADPGLTATGSLRCAPSPGRTPCERHGLLRMSPGGRSVVHADGTPFFMVADTAWALPFRATPEECREYASFRKPQGFNAALLMTVQPDRRVVGPRDRTAPDGFDVAFDDLPDGTLRRINGEYFRRLDVLTGILVEHGIVPVHQPVFHGYGWRGGDTAGRALTPEDYARFCRYLVARYGARPAMWLVNGDGPGYLDSVDAAGQAIHDTDAYAQPTGNHYSPNADNRAFQDREWLDFQWCQTGHSGEHRQDKVADMWRNEPPKAVANGEPTYENIGAAGKAAGRWQFQEAWANVCSGGTMGVVYGAGSLWQWLRPEDTPPQDWCRAPGAFWREALRFEGAAGVGNVGRILRGYPTADMAKRDDFSYGCRTVAVPGRFAAFYLERGDSFEVISRECPPDYAVYDPETGERLSEGRLTPESRRVPLAGNGPRVVVFGRRNPEP